MKNIELETQKKALNVFNDLEKEYNAISRKTNVLGWQQRNELITHVYSDYKNHENLNKKRNEWKESLRHEKALKWIHDLFAKNRDLFGYFENYNYIINEIDSLIETSAKMEKFEIASILKDWRNKLPNS